MGEHRGQVRPFIKVFPHSSLSPDRLGNQRKRDEE